MTISSTKLIDVLYSIEENCARADYQHSVVPCMIDCAKLIAHEMTPATAESFQIAQRYVNQATSLQSVSDAISSCWKELEHGREMRVSDPEVSATRAVLCILHAQLHGPSDEFLDAMSFFLQLINNAEPHHQEELELLQHHFASCLKVE
jgi:hypothetical protein